MIEKAFYKKNEESILVAFSKVYNEDYTLDIDKKNTYIYPVDGWYYFDYIEDALDQFNIPEVKWDEIKIKHMFLV